MFHLYVTRVKNRERVQEALKKMGGKSLRAAPMVAAAGTPSGEAFAYKGKQSWVFVSVSYSSMPSGSYTVMLDDAEGSPCP